MKIRVLIKDLNFGLIFGMKYKSFRDFYPFYLTQHSNKYCRLLHLLGTSAGLLWFFCCIYTANYKFIPLTFVYGYGASWIGHFVFEKNKPAAFSQPFYSFLADFRMLFEVITFRRGLTD